MFTVLIRVFINSCGVFGPANTKLLDEIKFTESEESGIIQPQLGAPKITIKATLNATALNKLPEELRTALALREFEGLSYEEIAQIMVCPVGTVRSRIFRARDALDRQLTVLHRFEKK